MTTKEAIHERVELLDEADATKLLEFIEELTGDSGGVAVEDTQGAEQFADDLIQPRAGESDPRLALIGIVRSARPTNIAEFKDEYIADAILHRDLTDS